jgi:hypothetical protein
MTPPFRVKCCHARAEAFAAQAIKAHQAIVVDRIRQGNSWTLGARVQSVALVAMDLAASCHRGVER